VARFVPRCGHTLAVDRDVPGGNERDFHERLVDQFRREYGLGPEVPSGEIRHSDEFERWLRRGNVPAPAAAPTFRTVPQATPVSGCGTVTPGMDPALARPIIDCVTHRRFVNIMAQSAANIALVDSPYAPGIASVYDTVVSQVAASSQVPTDTSSVDYTTGSLSLRVSSVTTLPVPSFTVTLAHLGTGTDNGSWNVLTGKLTLNETSRSAIVQDQADVERTMYHEMVHFMGDVVTHTSNTAPPGSPPVREPALQNSLPESYGTEFKAATVPIFQDMLANVALVGGSTTFSALQLARAQWAFRVPGEIITRVEEQIYLALRAGRGFTTADMRAMSQDWILATPEYWDVLRVFDRTSLETYLRTHRTTLERDVLPIVQRVQERYMYLRRVM